MKTTFDILLLLLVAVGRLTAMQRNLAHGLGTSVSPMLLTVVMLPSLLEAAEADSKAGMNGFDTPQSLVATYNHAIAAKDWRTCFLCYDPKMRADFLVGMFYGVAVSRDAELAAIVKKRLSGKHAGIEGAGRGTDSKLRFYEVLQKQLDDLPGFVGEICHRFDVMGQETFTQFGDIREITIRGDKAIGYWTPYVVKNAGANSKVGSELANQGQSLSTKGEPIQFCRIGGKWYITITDPPPPLSINERAKLLKAEGESLFVYLACSTPVTAVEDQTKPGTYQFLAGKQYDELRLTVRPVYGGYAPTIHVAQLTEAQAKKLIDYLADEGYLRQAVELGKQDVPERDLSQNCYTLQVSTQTLQLHEDLGWGPKMLKRLEGLRGALEGEAARAMDAILSGLVDDRKKWATVTTEPTPPQSHQQ